MLILYVNEALYIILTGLNDCMSPKHVNCCWNLSRVKLRNNNIIKWNLLQQESNTPYTKW